MFLYSDRTDTDSRPHKCQFCGKKYARPDIRNRHERLSHIEKDAREAKKEAKKAREWCDSVERNRKAAWIEATPTQATTDVVAALIEAIPTEATWRRESRGLDELLPF